MMGNDGKQDDLPARIALEAGVSRQLVLTTFQQHGLPLASAAALPRPLRVSRLRIAGDRTVTPKGPFDTTLELGNSLTVLVAKVLLRCRWSWAEEGLTDEVVESSSPVVAAEVSLQGIQVSG
ncbi:hypothetical protein [Plantactinospora soyae]|uniref:Uncharacterized protein n=1 Tax=Plantactinospora soyae TaxID=1544732 RepID=A0A927MDL3_9ACTN|nr:hypothetical protein [Plantactinospora soyae]MBE1489145.1 hypothetical protein [Plantactinospora soyae]